ncbi:hypothetical protein RRG08_002408 [Elysia crispata]|uniref:Uncharacterized protein n=1 Tax=Elysia crispata TaxID=231223 RepID=A0AAE0ZFW3_9GAST|nr:hypothetical protein RRG08_002408 [Elysia crispata]
MKAVEFPTELSQRKRRQNRNTNHREYLVEYRCRLYNKPPTMETYGTSSFRAVHVAQLLVLLTVAMFGVASGQDYRIPTSSKEETDNRESTLQPGIHMQRLNKTVANTIILGENKLERNNVTILCHDGLCHEKLM